MIIEINRNNDEMILWEEITDIPFPNEQNVKAKKEDRKEET